MKSRDTAHLCEIDQTPEAQAYARGEAEHPIFADAPTLELTHQPITLDDLRSLYA